MDLHRESKKLAQQLLISSSLHAIEIDPQ